MDSDTHISIISSTLTSCANTPCINNHFQSLAPMAESIFAGRVDQTNFDPSGAVYERVRSSVIFVYVPLRFLRPAL